MSIHLELAAMIDAEFSDQLAGPLEPRQDSLVVSLRNGVRLTIHYAGQDAYSLRWQFEGGEAGIDTAPMHRGLTTFPHHYHAPDGQVLADPLTSPERSPRENLRGLLQALARSPRLDKPVSG